MSKNKNVMIKTIATEPLMLCESVGGDGSQKRYRFKGIFTACSDENHTVINRNNRIYPLKEMMRHMGYLREMVKNHQLLGELDHPDSRFETSLKEAALVVEDLYINSSDSTIRGQILLLDTPMGKIAQELYCNEDASKRIPVCISSRCAGTVDEKTREVSITQCFGYDLVQLSGFAEAVLQRVDESLTTEARQYLTESLAYQKKVKEDNAKKYGNMLCEGVTVYDMDCGDVKVPQYIQEAINKPYDIDELSKPLNEEDSEDFTLPMTDTNPLSVTEDDDKDSTEDGKSEEEKTKKPDSESKDDSESTTKEEKHELTDEEKKAKRAKILNVEAIDADGEGSTEAEKEEKRSKILDVEAVEDDGKDTKDDKDSKDDHTDDKDSKEKSDKEKSDKEKSDDKDKNSDDVAECDDAAKEDASCQTTKDKEEKEKILNDNDKSGEEVKKRTDKSIEDLQKLLDKAKKVADVKESIVNAYPFSISLSDENFAKFAALNINQKNKVNQYIVDHAIIDVCGINECWMTPLIEEKRQLKNWLRLASEEDKKLFVDAPKDVQDAIEESAKYVMINTKADAERFWKSTGLRQRHAQQILTESMSGRYELSEENKQKVETIAKSNELGYSMDYFKMVEDMY